jgi:hypothetical protein
MSVNKINDGGKTYGSSTLAIKKFNGTTYVARGTYYTDDFSTTQATTSKEFTDSDDIPTGQIIVRGKMSGKATVQFASSVTEQIEIGDVFKWLDVGGNAFYFIVDNVEKQESKGDEGKQPITFVRAINPTAVAVTAAGGSPVTVDLTGVT